MAVNIDRKQAEQVLSEAFGNECKKNDTITKGIEFILNGTHKTYKYVLVNGLLAKASNPLANPLTLQVGSKLTGAYDARSLCHQVLVPFERDHLKSALGGSNEPFLNKPARFTELSTGNAVRGGNDKKALLTLIYIFENLKSQEDAKGYLTHSLGILKERIEALQQLATSKISYSPTLVEIYRFIDVFVSKSYEGETCAIVIGALENLFYSRFNDNYEVKPHKVNQSGASSKETGDIDIFKNGKLLCAIEVKDKDFNEYDLEHSFIKMIQEGAKKGEFIYGPRAKFDTNLINRKIGEYEDKGFYILFHNVHQYSRMLLYKADPESTSEFIEAVYKVAKEINCKELTLGWIQEVIQKVGWSK
jgi:SacI restriction endonuclease